MDVTLVYNGNLAGTEREMDFDVDSTVHAICSTIEQTGRSVRPFPVSATLKETVERLSELKTGIILNIAAENLPQASDAFYPAIFERLCLPFAGSGARAAMLALDKNMTKILCERRRIPTPRGEFIDRQNPLPPEDEFALRFPVIVKPCFGESSKGISPSSIFSDYQSLQLGLPERILSFPSGLLVEEFIEGREVTVAYVENLTRVPDGVLPPLELKFPARRVSERAYTLYDFELKHDHNQTLKIQTAPLIQMENAVTKMERYTLRAAKALGISGYCRADFRMVNEDEIYLLEVNAFPTLSPVPPRSTVLLSAALAGVSASEVFEAILQLPKK